MFILVAFLQAGKIFNLEAKQVGNTEFIAKSDRLMYTSESESKATWLLDNNVVHSYWVWAPPIRDLCYLMFRLCEFQIEKSKSKSTPATPATRDRAPAYSPGPAQHH